MTMRHHRYLFGLAAVMLLPGMSLAAEPVALVTASQGKPVAGLELYSEVEDGAVLKLGAGQGVTLLHYRSCRNVTVTSGEAVVTRRAVEAKGAMVEETAAENCPQEVSVTTTGVGGGALVRAVGFVTMPARLDCIIVGEKRKKVSKVEVVLDDKTVQSLPVVGGRITSPADAVPLDGEREYQLRLISGKSVLSEGKVGIVESKPGRICLIRVD